MTTTPILRSEADYNRSCFMDFTDRMAAVDAIVALTEESPTPFVVLGIFDYADSVSVYFRLAVGEGKARGTNCWVTNDYGIPVWIPGAYEGEPQFHARAKALGGEYTGS